MAYTTINKCTAHFNTKTYTGANKTITGVGFQPDLVWIKERDTAGHAVFDAVRGATKLLETNDTPAENTQSTSLTAFASDGFTLGADSGNYVGGSSTSVVSWNWKGNGSGSANTDGNINSTVSVNATSKFSIVSYTGTGSVGTIGHGLGVAPSLIITKSLVATQEWGVYHKTLGATKYAFLNETSAVGTNTAYWNDTAPTSTVFTVGTSGPTNSSSAMIAYCFADVDGFSKTGSYFGNYNANGTYTHTGFKPQWVVVKKVAATGSWRMFDSVRATGENPADKWLDANGSGAEGTDVQADLVGSGFKVRDSANAFNTNDVEYIFIAFGQTTVGTNNVPCTAR